MRRRRITLVFVELDFIFARIKWTATLSSFAMSCGAGAVGSRREVAEVGIGPNVCGGIVDGGLYSGGRD
jgi:hypothetical protein